MFAICGMAVVGLAILEYWVTGGFSWSWLALLPILLILALPVSLARGKGPTTLKLDEDGLTYAHMYASHRWRWAELSAPEIRHPDTLIDPYIALRPDRPGDWKARLTLPALHARGTELRIRSIFDTPLPAICAELAEYRERALAGGRGRETP